MLILQGLLGFALTWICLGGATVVYDIVRSYIKRRDDMDMTFYVQLVLFWPFYWRMRIRRRSW